MGDDAEKEMLENDWRDWLTKWLFSGDETVGGL